ncbi:polysaccharide biosynthesis protein [Cellulomonas sp. Sa3CUA2]|uniref:Polysaccharide biosynthesis protein n=1 Tax=Cellulomonas avistercoris TaxID=2762242 RepID=A0ABR8QDT1_9CELL|nr:polysaccharide biosynthesis protein [Cellulomonas avistercoris]MBD7918593.1 polysaccharide biosynthesis protein [Cellulomonas avistercoris]
MTTDRRLPRPQDLLPASRPPVGSAAVRALVAGRRVLVTGAAGSVGAALVRRLTGLAPAALHLLDVDEGRLHAQQLELTGRGFTRSSQVLLADVRDARALDAAFARAAPDLVLHAAALKHVALLETFGCVGVMTNVWGTQNVVRAAHRHGVERVVHVSSDKAADPTSVLGATQRLAELVVRGEDGPRAASVRFGTALGSRGSFWDTLVHQTAAGLPVTVTDPDATRSLMTLDEAAALVLEVAALAHGGETYVLDMGERVRVLDLVHRYAALAGLPAPRVTVTGLLPGEKQHETLVAEGERHRPTGVDRVLRCPPVTRPPGFDRVLSDLYAAADDADEPRVRRLLGEQFAGLRARLDDDRAPDGHVPRSGPGPALRVLGPVPA